MTSTNSHSTCDYDDRWLKEVDAKLLLAPTESFEDACRGSLSFSRGSSRSSSIDFGYGNKPLPDVPVDFDDDEDDEDSLDGSEWEYPVYAQRLGFVEAHCVVDPRFLVQKNH